MISPHSIEDLWNLWTNSHTLEAASHRANAWTAIDRLSIVWKTHLSNEIKRSSFQAVSMLILLYGCTIWTMTKRMERNLEDNCTKRLRAVFNKSWRQHPTQPQLYGHLPSISKTVQIRQSKQAGHYWSSKGEIISDVLLWNPHTDDQVYSDQLEPIHNRSVLIQDVAWKTCREWSTTGMSGRRGSGKSVLAARHDDVDDDSINYLAVIFHE